MTSRRTVFASALALGGAGLLGAPIVRARQATPAASADDAIMVPVEVKEFEVDAHQVVFRVGEAYRFAVENGGKIPHEFLIEPIDAMDVALEENGAVAEVADIAPGTTKTLDWTFSEPGRYKLACHIPGHYEAGMRLPIDVVEDAQVVEVETSEFAVKLDPTSVQAGKPVAFVVRNVGKLEHEIVVQPAGAMDEPYEQGDDDDDEETMRVSEIEDIEPGTRREMIWTFDDPGKIDVACHVEGHYEAGMVSTLEVTA